MLAILFLLSCILVAKPVPFLTSTVAAISGIIAVAVVAAGLLIYFKKRKAVTQPMIEGQMR